MGLRDLNTACKHMEVKNKQAVVMTLRRRISEIASLRSHLVLSHVISLGKKRSAVVRE